MASPRLSPRLTTTRHSLLAASVVALTAAACGNITRSDAVQQDLADAAAAKEQINVLGSATATPEDQPLGKIHDGPNTSSDTLEDGPSAETDLAVVPAGRLPTSAETPPMLILPASKLGLPLPRAD